MITQVRCHEHSSALLQSRPVSARYYRVAVLGPAFPAPDELSVSSAVGQMSGARAACWFVPERNQHHGADGHCRVDDRGENPCSCRAVPNTLHQISQRQETHGERACADGGNSADRPAVNPAGRSRTDGEGNAVHGGEKGDGRHSGGTDLDHNARDVRQYGMRDAADQADRGRADQEAPEESDSTVGGSAP